MRYAPNQCHVSSIFPVTHTPLLLLAQRVTGPILHVHIPKWQNLGFGLLTGQTTNMTVRCSLQGVKESGWILACYLCWQARMNAFLLCVPGHDTSMVGKLCLQVWTLCGRHLSALGTHIYTLTGIAWELGPSLLTLTCINPHRLW